MNRNELLEAIQQRCITCYWHDWDNWQNCKNTQCPNHSIVNDDRVATAKVEELRAMIANVCTTCIGNGRVKCDPLCPYAQTVPSNLKCAQ